MKSNKINTTNTNPKAGNNLLVKASQYNDLWEDVNFLYPSINQPFIGKISLAKTYTQYADYKVSAALVVALDNTLITGGSAEIRFIGDGITTPTFSSDFTTSSGTDVYDSTLNAINKVIFYYDGVETFYSITVL